MRIKQLYFFVILISISLFSCNPAPEEPEDMNADLVVITRAQFASEKMALGEPTRQPFAEMIHFTGAIVPGVNGIAHISLPVPGLIRKIFGKPGQFVHKGTPLFEVSGNELVDLQRDFAESSAILKRLRSEFERAGALRSDNIGTQKEFIAIESAFYAESAKYNALKIKIQTIGLDVSSIEGGSMFPSYFVRSPLEGYIVSVDATIGQFLEPQQKIAEIVDAGTYQVKFSVFERDIQKVKVGQSMRFYLNGDKTVSYDGHVSAVGMNLAQETKSVSCYGSILNMPKLSMISNQFAEGDIFLAVDSALAVPQTAVVKSGDHTYVLMLEREDEQHYYFKKARVIPGRMNDELIELTDRLPTGKLLISGLYNIQVE
jgi:membrane fusion protein, heavy metal efflux system